MDAIDIGAPVGVAGRARDRSPGGVVQLAGIMIIRIYSLSGPAFYSLVSSTYFPWVSHFVALVERVAAIPA